MINLDLTLSAVRQRPKQLVVNGRFLARPHRGVARVGVELLRALLTEIEASSSPVPLRVATPAGTAVGVESRMSALRGPGFASQLGEQALPFLYPQATLINFCNVTPLLAWRSIVWIHDTNIFDAPESYPKSYRLWHRAMLATIKARRFDVVTVSKFAMSSLIARGVPPERIRVIYNGGDHILAVPEDEAVFSRVHLDKAGYVLLVGSPAPHKNLPFALRALVASDTTLKFAIVGLAQDGPYAEGARLRQDPRIVVLPRLSDAELRALYHHASAVVCPSLCEGFGLYAAEAMFAESGPLLLSNRGALPEVGGDAALYFDPTDEAALQRALSLALQPETRSRLLSAAREQRKKFTWQRAAREVIAGYLS